MFSRLHNNLFLFFLKVFTSCHYSRGQWCCIKNDWFILWWPLPQHTEQPETGTSGYYLYYYYFVCILANLSSISDFSFTLNHSLLISDCLAFGRHHRAASYSRAVTEGRLWRVPGGWLWEYRPPYRLQERFNGLFWPPNAGLPAAPPNHPPDTKL